MAQKNYVYQTKTKYAKQVWNDMYVLYLDSFLLYHSVITICMVLSIKQISGMEAPVKRILPGMALNCLLLGVVVAKKLFLCRMLWGITYIAVNLLTMLYIFKITKGRSLFIMLMLYLMNACFVSGVIKLAYEHGGGFFGDNLWLYLLLILFSFGVMEAGRRLFSLIMVNRTRERKVILHDKEHMVLTEALYDTGNSLNDIVTGDPVHIISKSLAMKLGRPLEENTKLPEGVRFIPYATIDKQSGLMMVFRIDYMEIYSGSQMKRWEKPLLGVANGLADTKDSVQLILNCRTE